MCDYKDCNKKISEESKKLVNPSSARYCEEHDRMFNDAVDNNDNGTLMKMLVNTIKK